jgi:hypothetical protein
MHGCRAERGPPCARRSGRRDFLFRRHDFGDQRANPLALGVRCNPPDIPFIPGVRDIPRWIPVYKLIWRDHYRAAQ